MGNHKRVNGEPYRTIKDEMGPWRILQDYWGPFDLIENPPGRGGSKGCMRFATPNSIKAWFVVFLALFLVAGWLGGWLEKFESRLSQLPTELELKLELSLAKFASSLQDFSYRCYVNKCRICCPFNKNVLTPTATKMNTTNLVTRRNLHRLPRDKIDLRMTR